MGRFQAWVLESRARYALVWGGINAATFCSIYVLARFPDVSVGSVLSTAALASVISVAAQGLIWYPRAKRKPSARPG